ncbi:hypothetical protein [Nostoc sp.]
MLYPDELAIADKISCCYRRREEIIAKYLPAIMLNIKVKNEIFSFLLY